MASTPAPEAGPPELSATGRVILGMIAFGRTTGYDIKQLVDKTTRYFWAASYGQIYPELKRLEDAPSTSSPRRASVRCKAGWPRTRSRSTRFATRGC